ncbi:hypothetical protein [Leptospira stimsonii]|uniref:Uncharacterized protein n=1 Tax=Leptospira stimsonii TaxID=2202203 RepID=A0A396YW42_9LEPT|nr:hypothetical protein [Leptospira stimsonii]RHX85648.1 hypothetical protein DLM75_20915 [Leptospira stimsonii]
MIEDDLEYLILLTFSSILEILILEIFLGEELAPDRNEIRLILHFPLFVRLRPEQEWTWSIAMGLKILDDSSSEFIQNQDLTIGFVFFFGHLNIGLYAVRLLEKMRQNEGSMQFDYEVKSEG